MRILKVALLSLSSAIIVVITAAGFLYLYASTDKEDSFFLLNAELANANYLREFTPRSPAFSPDEEEQLIVHSHRLKPGRGSIFGYRFYSNGSLSMIDDEHYRKITIWIAAPLPSLPATIALSDDSAAVAIFTSGGSAWPRAGCAGYLSPGEIGIARNGRSYVVRLHAELTPIPDSTWLPSCGAESVQLTFKASEINSEDVTPWLGTRGAHPYDETYR